MNTKVAIVEDIAELRMSFREIVQAAEGFEVIGDFESVEEAMTGLKQTPADVVLMDLMLPGINGIAGIRKIKTFAPQTSFIMITVHQESKYIFEALCAGAVGYLTKNLTPEELISALNQVNAGGAPMSASIARKVVASFVVPTEENLTDRENEVLQLLAKGKSYASISDTLNVSINTIKTHTRNIYEKLHVNSKEEIVKKYGG